MPAQDYRTWDWGGSMAIHRLTQLSDGDLAAQNLALFSFGPSDFQNLHLFLPSENRPTPPAF